MAATRTIDRNRGTIVAAFHSHREAQKAVRDLKEAGFTDEQIGVLAQDQEGLYTDDGDLVRGEGNRAAEGAAAGAATGLGVGALWGLGIVSGVLPAIGPAIAGGALAAILSSAAGTAVAGGIVGALAGMGIPEEEAEFYHEEFERGRTVVTVRATGEEADRAARILDQANAYDFARRESSFASDPAATERVDLEGRPVPRRDVA
jgi:hypothetical protein